MTQDPSRQDRSDDPAAGSVLPPRLLEPPEPAADVTRLWLIRHALVEQNARLMLYGTMDVPLCPESLLAQAPMYRALAARLPRTTHWYATPLSRTQETARAIQRAGYGETAWQIEPDLVEQNLGAWQGLAHAALPPLLTREPHSFWPVAASEVPPDGESFEQMCRRVADALDRLAARHAGQDVVAVSHGGAIRAALAHALGVGSETALRFAVQNLSVSILERHPCSWRVLAVNELAGV